MKLSLTLKLPESGISMWIRDNGLEDCSRRTMQLRDNGFEVCSRRFNDAILQFARPKDATDLSTLKRIELSLRLDSEKNLLHARRTSKVTRYYYYDES